MNGSSNIVDRVLQTNIYIQPIHFVLAVLANALNIRILSSSALRASPCTHYFLTYAILSIIYACLLCPIQFARSFSVNLIHDMISCKLHAYFLFAIPLQANLMIILASFDRFCASIQLNRLQSLNTILIARRNIVLSILFSLCYMLPMLFIYHWNDSSKKCFLQNNLIIKIYISSQVLVYYVVSPVLLVIFGILTIYNIHERSTRIKPLISTAAHRRTETQLARMLFLQVLVHFIFILPFGILYSLNSFVPSTEIPKIIAIRLICVTWQQGDYFISFFLYILSANIYRQEFMRIINSMNCSIHRRTDYFSPRLQVQYDKIELSVKTTYSLA
ncbi:unnamed protein product [Adineta ricciae]|uniref:G-protein coupled receptors family 1 profile domain-containing protein n=1 Tax=Adineta ricciae TaxID=249248 RepID=A0A813R3R9_ADIRI|nr:unnamed protein product [Adineta ricciae]CAF0776100.1 unnamed protein product [Adineta ricciae]